MSDRHIPFGRPMLDQAEIDAVARVLAGTQLVHGPVAEAFETAFAARVGVEHAVSLSSCTAGLQLSLLSHGVGAGDEVIVPAMGHVAAAHAVEFCGATPIFVDVEPDSGNINPEKFSHAIGPCTRAAIVVHYLGLPCDMARILPPARQAGLLLVEDCALAVDATYDGRKAGGLGDVGCFSFYPVKHLTTLEGGMAVTSDTARAAAIRKRRAFGYDRSLGEREVPGVYDVDALGGNYRMNEAEAAVGLVQLGKLDGFQAARAANHAALKEGLSTIDEVTVFEVRKGKAVSSHYCLNAVLPRDGRIDRSRVIGHLQARGVGTSVHYPKALPRTRYYSERYGHRPGTFPVAEWLAEQTISLPVGPHLGTGDPERIADAFGAAVMAAR